MKATLIARLRGLGMSYGQYLASEHWQKVKARYRMSSLPQECLGCGERRVQLHHITYCRLGHELLTDLIPLCDICHGKVHAYEESHSTNLWSIAKIMQCVFGWSKAKAREKLEPFNAFGIKNLLGEEVHLTNKQKIRELRRSDPDNPAYWTAKQKARKALK